MPNDPRQTTNLSPRAQGIRRKLYRNRQISYPPNSVDTDGSGNILKRPLTKKLLCFADPVEWMMGQFDRPRVWGDSKPAANGCAGCPVRVFCSMVAWERIQSSDELVKLHAQWELETRLLTGDARHQHPTWANLVTAYERMTWTDDNDRKLEDEKREARERKLAQARRGAQARRKQNKRKPRSVPRWLQEKIQKYRDERLAELMAKRADPNAPLWLRNRAPERCILIADAWQAREILEREHRKSSARAVLEWLIEHGRVPHPVPKGMVQRVGEALKRIEKLESEREWPVFDPYSRPTPPPPPGWVIWELGDDAQNVQVIYLEPDDPILNFDLDFDGGFTPAASRKPPSQCGS